MKRSLIVVLAGITAAFSAATPFDDLITDAKQQLLSFDYAQAGLILAQARQSVASLGAVKQDFSSLRAAGFTGHGSATTDMVLGALADASAKHSINDTVGTVRALDLAIMAVGDLTVSQPPAQRYTLAKNSLQKATAAGVSGGNLDPYLHRAASAAYAVGQYDESLAYVNQILAIPRTKSVAFPIIHWAHTIAGLDYLAKGEVASAVSELNVSAQSFASAAFLPSMALANALVAKNPEAVLSYLDAASSIKLWTGKVQVAAWKAQVQAGQSPKFGDLVTMGLI